MHFKVSAFFFAMKKIKVLGMNSEMDQCRIAATQSQLKPHCKKEGTTYCRARHSANDLYQDQ